MTISDTLKSVRIVTAAELEVNGGRFKLRQGPATKVRGYTTSNIGSRMVKGGDAQPVYVLSDTDIRSGGGRWRVNAGQAIQVTDVIGDTRGVIQGSAIPVFPVDDAGNYDPNFAGYASKVLGTQSANLIAYWPLWETSGAIAEDISGNGLHGAYTGVTLGQDGIGDGNTCPLFDGANDFVNIYSVGLNTLFDGSEHSILLWIKVFDVGVWTDAVARYPIHIGVDIATNYTSIFRTAVNGQLRWRREGSGVSQIVDRAGESTVDWIPVVATISESANEFKAYWNGVQEGLTQVGLGAYVGNLAVNLCNIGARNTIPASPWHGYLAHCAIWDRPLTDAEILNLATV